MLHIDSTFDVVGCIELLRRAQLDEPLQRKPGNLLGVINKACSSYKSGRDGYFPDSADNLLLTEKGNDVLANF
jgi:chitin synthase